MTWEVRLQARKLVPEAILQKIILLNNLDMELYEHAKKIFTQEHLMLKAQHSVVGQHRQLAEQKGWIGMVCNDGIYSPWMVVMLGLGITTIIVLVSFAVTTRRRTSKLKV
uniref:Uncharacterized protein n=1 Tax=Arundo donax TaxID=35708 RepID=A0A0A9GHW2_ARUDO